MASILLKLSLNPTRIILYMHAWMGCHKHGMLPLFWRGWYSFILKMYILTSLRCESSVIVLFAHFPIWRKKRQKFGSFTFGLPSLLTSILQSRRTRSAEDIKVFCCKSPQWLWIYQFSLKQPLLKALFWRCLNSMPFFFPLEMSARHVPLKAIINKVQLKAKEVFKKLFHFKKNFPINCLSHHRLSIVIRYLDL